MNVQDWLLPPDILAPLASIAASAVLASFACLLLDALLRRSGRSPALRHAVIVASLIAMLSLPAIVVALHSRGMGWSVAWFDHAEPPAPPATASPSPPAVAFNAAAEWQQAILAAVGESSEPLSATDIDSPAATTASSISEPPEALRSPLQDFAASQRQAVIPAAAVSRTDSLSALIRTHFIRAVGTVVMILWIVGVFLAAWRFSRSSRLLRRILSRATSIDEPELRQLGERLSTRLHRFRRPRLLWSDWLLSPIHCGLLRPTIVLPRRLAEDFSLAEWRAVLLHEIEHVARGDLFIGLVQRIAVIAYWWNPPLYRLNSRLDDLREDLCDDAVVNGGVDRQNYARLLVAVADAATRPAFPAVAIGLTRASGFTNRISRLVNEDRPMSTIMSWKARLLLLILVFGMSGAVVAATLVRPAYEQDNLLSRLFHAFSPESSATGSAADEVAPDSKSAVAFEDAAPAPDFRDSFTEPAVTNVEAAPSDPIAAEGAILPSPETPAAAEFPAVQGLEPFAATPPPASNPAAPSADAPFAIEPGVRLIPGTDPYTTAPQPIYGDPAATPFGAPVPGHPILLLVALSCDASGKLSNIQFFNKPLGSDEQALKALRDFVMDRKTKADSIGAGLVVQIEAPAAIRFDNIQSVTEVINDSGAEIRFKVQDAAPTFTTKYEQGLPKSQGPLEISVVFVRDASGKKLSSKPVVCVDDEVLRPDELATRLIHGAPPGSSAEAVRTLPSGVWITAEQDVPYEVLEGVVRAVSQRGISKVRFVVKDQATNATAAPTYTPVDATSDEFQSRRNAEPQPGTGLN